MAHITQPMTYEDIRILSPQDYARFQDAAKAHAHMLRQEAIARCWSAFGRWVARRFNAPRSSRKGRPVKPYLA